MERDSLHGLNQPLSLYCRNPIMEEQPFVSRTFWSSSPSHIPSKGILKAPPFSLFHSAPFLLQPPPQPPLLPLPATLPRRSSSCPNPNFSPATKNGARKNPKKPVKYSTKKEEKKAPKRFSTTLSISSPSNSGDFTAEQPKNLASVSRFSPMISKGNSVIEEPGLVEFTISPPPSSLPLPTFSMRRKEVAAGIDSGASDDLRRLLRLP